MTSTSEQGDTSARHPLSWDLGPETATNPVQEIAFNRLHYLHGDNVGRSKLTFQPVEFCEVSTVIGTYAHAEKELELSNKLNSTAKEGHPSYDVNGVQHITRAFAKVRQNDYFTSSGDNNHVDLECRMQECYSAVSRTLFPGEQHLNQALAVAMGASANKVRRVRAVAYTLQLYFGGGLVIYNKMLWPQDKSLARLVQYTFDTPEKPEYRVESTFSPCGRMLFRSIHLHHTHQERGEISILAGLSDLVSSLYCILDLALDRSKRIMEGFTFSDMQNDLMSFFLLFASCDPKVHSVIRDIFDLSRIGEEKVSEKLVDVAAQVFFVCNVFDAITAGSTLDKALERSSAYSRAVYLLRERETNCDADLKVYDLFNDGEEARKVYKHLQNLVSKRRFRSLSAPRRTNIAAIEALEGYQALTADDVSDEDIVQVGSGMLPRTNGWIEKKGAMRGTDWTISCTAVMRGDDLIVTVNESISPEVREKVDQWKAKLRAEDEQPRWNDFEPELNLAWVRSPNELVINAYISGHCGDGAARWMLQRLVQGSVHVSNLSTSDLKVFLKTVDDNDAPVLRANLTPSVLDSLPALFNPSTKDTLLVVDLAVRPCKIAERDGSYVTEDGPVTVGENFKNCVLREIRKGAESSREILNASNFTSELEPDLTDHEQEIGRDRVSTADACAGAHGPSTASTAQHAMEADNAKQSSTSRRRAFVSGERTKIHFGGMSWQFQASIKPRHGVGHPDILKSVKLVIDSSSVSQLEHELDVDNEKSGTRPSECARDDRGDLRADQVMQDPDSQVVSTPSARDDIDNDAERAVSGTTSENRVAVFAERHRHVTAGAATSGTLSSCAEDDAYTESPEGLKEAAERLCSELACALEENRRKEVEGARACRELENELKSQSDRALEAERKTSEDSAELRLVQEKTRKMRRFAEQMCKALLADRRIRSMEVMGTGKDLGMRMQQEAYTRQRKAELEGDGSSDIEVTHVDIDMTSTGVCANEPMAFSQTWCPECEENAKAARGDMIMSGQRVLSGEQLLSQNRRFALVVEEDGDLAIRDNKKAPGERVIWNSDTGGAGLCTLKLLDDGDLVLVNEGTQVWSAGTAGIGPSIGVMNNDGNFVLYDGDGAAWSSESWRPACCHYWPSGCRI